MSIFPFTRKWRAPRWAPLFIRRRYLGVWTQEEVDRINLRASERAAEIQALFDEGPRP